MKEKYSQLIPLIEKYEYVWQLNDDILVNYFDFKEYYNIWKCSEGPLLGTLISQPPIIGLRTDVETELLINKINTASAISAETLEAHAAIVNSKFLQWHIINILVPVSSLNSDYVNYHSLV
jgi:hypothetical protein